MGDRMTNFPSPMSIPGPADMTPSRYLPHPTIQDTEGQDIARGAQNLAQGIDQVAQNLGDVAARQQQQENTVDIARADALKTQQFYAIQSRFNQDPDYSTFNQRAQPMVQDALDKSASLIRDDRMREQWLAQNESAKAQMLDSINTHGIALKQDAEKGALIGSLDTNAKLISDPTVPTAVREKARSDMAGAIFMGQHTGLLSAVEAQNLKAQKIDAADNALAVNLAQTDILNNPARVMTDMAIPTTNGGTAILDAQTAVDGKIVPLEFSLAKVTAQQMGDSNFPDDPKLAAAYLSDPQKAMEYQEAAAAHLSDRYKGDLGAVAIAMDPKGGTSVADRWVASGHKDYTLPAPVAARYHQVMASVTAEQPYQRLPIQTAPGVDLNTVDPNVLDRYEQLQSRFGVALPVINGAQSDHSNAPAINIDVSKLAPDQRSKLIEMASSMGFTGIGIGKDSLTFDTGNLRAWGPDGQADSVPAWAKDAVALHNSGQVNPLPSLYSGVAPEYANLTYDQRLQIYAKAKATLDNQNIDMRSSLQNVADNAPAAITATGHYDGDMPTANQFVQAYGGSEGIQRYRDFESKLDTAKTVYSMQTMSNSDILAAVNAATPTSGNTAALDYQRFNTIHTAAMSTLKAREDDPAGYTMSSFPAVAQAWQNANQNHALMPQALAAMSEAQKQLGIDHPELIPKSLADQAVTAFKDDTQPAQQRLAGVAGLVFATSDQNQQDAIYDQLVKAGLPSTMGGVLNAMRRTDTGAAQNLVRAALFDPSKLKVPLSVTPDQLKQQLADDVFSTGKIGDIVYGMTGASADNLGTAGDASDLMLRDAQLHLADGSARDAKSAVALATRDMFGDVQVVTGKGGFMGINAGTGLKVTLPKDVDQNAARTGFNALAPDVRSTLTSFLHGPGGLPQNTPDGMATAMQMGVDNYVNAVMDEGYFTNADGYVPNGQKGFVFMDPKMNSPVQIAPGKPMVFTLDDVLSGGVNRSGPPDNRIGQR
jgi:hypothetical protein